MGIRILIVDDDRLLVEKLENTVRWEKLGISMVFSAFNITQAKKLLSEYPIELLLCDIDMPQGSGLELLEWVRSRDMGTECVFLSSYANFAYAQMALQLSSREYLLKPISNAKLEEALERIVGEIYKKKERTGAILAEEGRYKEEFWEAFFRTALQEEHLLEEAVGRGLYRQEDRICIGMLRIWDNPSEENYRKNISLYDFIIRNLAEECFQAGEGLLPAGHGGFPAACGRLDAVIHQSDLEWALIFRLAGQEKELYEALLGVKGHLDETISRWSCLYLGNPVCFAEAAVGWRGLERLARQVVPAETGIVRQREVRLSGEADEELWRECRQAFPWAEWEKSLRRPGGEDGVEARIVSAVEGRRASGRWNVALQTRFVQEFMQIAYQALKDLGLGAGQFFEPGEFGSLERAACMTMKGLREFLEYLFEKLEGIQAVEGQQENVAERLKCYIEEHLPEELSRSLLAKKVFLSEDYVSKLFAKMTGMSIPNYIAARRIERAKEYLVRSQLPVSRIAMEVGYHNFSYFSKTFRELVGCTPNEFRSRMSKI